GGLTEKIKGIYIDKKARFFDSLLPLFYAKYIKDIRSVGILLGPYRNLSTLTASLMALHPNCQVLNHAGIRVFNYKWVNFLENYSDQKFSNFLKFAVYASLHGRRGPFGGGIFNSHAFDHDVVRKKYFERYNSNLKPNIHSIVWKEPLQVTNVIKQNSFSDILDNNQKLKFLLPIRNPINCAKSNLKTRHYKIFNKEVNNTKNCIAAIFEEFLLFLQLKDQYPTNFFYFFEDELKDKLTDIAEFLKIEKDQKWIEDASECFVVKSKYDNEEELKKEAIDLANYYFEHYPVFKNHLMYLVRK
ncbi:MAG: hypothetical protein BRD49_05305, partial [Bacteroidetes bacterium SW_10_40_5]